MKVEYKVKYPFDEYYATVRGQYEGDAGIDLISTIDCTLNPGEIVLIPAGIYVMIPKGYEGQIRARSGLALNHGISLANGVGTIDSNYRNELGAILVNLGKKPFEIKTGFRIAQFIVCPIVNPVFDRVFSFSDYAEDNPRNLKGFGSSGV
jgi:dUTP pyrophosphatase